MRSPASRVLGIVDSYNAVTMASIHAAIPGSFRYIEDKIRKELPGTTFGQAFELLCRYFLQTAPKYQGYFSKIWHWTEWPGRWGIDKGIDLVAQTTDGRLWAIQAKAVSPDRSIPKSELDSFLSESNRRAFDFRLIIATTDDIGRNAQDTIRGQEKPVGLVLRGDLLNADVVWPTFIGEPPRPLPKRKPRPHQAAAVRAVLRGFQGVDRGQLIMACGTGKTLTALWIGEKLKSRRTLVLVPSLSLVSQTLSEWGRNSTRPFDALVVCSDDTVTDRGDDPAVISTSDLGIPVTTEIAAIRGFLSQRRRGRSAVVFCTYQSSDRIAAAQKRWVPHFDLVIADEAHRCTGPAGTFTTVLDASNIKARRRLFMTATPRYFTGRVKKRAEELEYELASMDDESHFGPVFYRLTFETAISAGLLTDYQVVVIGVSQAELRQWAEEGRLVRTRDGLLTDARTLAAQVGLAKAMRTHDLTKIITFHSSVAKARRFTDPLVAESLVGVIDRMSRSSKPTGELWSAHISGETPTGRRKTLLDKFKGLPNGIRGVLSNCACLGEGVDVPVLDGIAFIDPKRSMVDIIQAVGRVMRRAEDKRIGTVVIPVFVDESDDADQSLCNSAFEPVWQVLRALRAHDSKLADELDDLRLKLGSRSLNGGRIQLPAKIKLDVPTLVLRDFEQAFYARTLEKTTCKPLLTEQQILAWADEYQSREGAWPTTKSGRVHHAPEESWSGIDFALGAGRRGLPGRSSLAKLLAKYRRKRNIQDLPLLTCEQILAWADAYHKRIGKWPTVNSGRVHEAPDESWAGIRRALATGSRGLPDGYSLARLLLEERGVRKQYVLAPLTEAQILQWADAFQAHKGIWPRKNSGALECVPGETWSSIDSALHVGHRSLCGGSSLARLLAEKRGVRNEKSLPRLTERQILNWADGFFSQHGVWPEASSGSIHDSLGETWMGMENALRSGGRGLAGGSSLAQLLSQHRNARNRKGLPLLTKKQILQWADQFHEQTGEWPKRESGAIPDIAGETWFSIDRALRNGGRGLAGGTSLAQLLDKKRGVPNQKDRPALTVEIVLGWADEHNTGTGKWPTRASGPVVDQLRETWSAVDGALKTGSRGLSGGSSGSSLAELLRKHRGVRNVQNVPALTINQILLWADEHYKRTGKWPGQASGPVQEAPAETWAAIHIALYRGRRGFSGGSSLAMLLAERRGARNKQALPPLTTRQILLWALAHRKRTGKWPNRSAGEIHGAPGETWSAIEVALKKGHRGLPVGTSLARLLARHGTMHDVTPRLL